MLRELIRDVKNKHHILGAINPGHELLKFFYFDEKGVFFRTNEEDSLRAEFTARFRGEVPSPEEYEKMQDKPPYEKYISILMNSLFSNYRKTLEAEIERIQKMN